ncbi:MAG TPA: sodium:proton antiporter [Candidatus Baltobacteraceae bacterium]|jgi:Na+/H+ antiporter NhaD/arsenite permease-like protein|nr:sodium:proton antiporter [Candidatus Baltobacteraceae bacterium]
MHQPSWWMVVPFGVLLASMAILPLHAERWWTRHYAKLALFLAALTLCHYLVNPTAEDLETVRRTAQDYIGFIALIGSLYVVSGGIHIQVVGEATPALNTLFLAVGGVVSNVLGTTGASMLLIRPWLRMNSYRTTAHHVVFFIFIVSNVGGCLTPIGDPPLLVGFLKGVPFWWVLEHCWAMWLISMAFLLAVFYCVDLRNYRRAPETVREKLAEAEHRWRFDGLWNTAFLAVIIGAVFLPGPPILGWALMLAAAAASYLTTARDVHAANRFSFGPIVEVAVLFFGIFATMMPMLDRLLNVGGSLSPGQVYWAGGTLSGFLDSAPAYLAFFSAVLGRHPASATASLLPAAAGKIVALSVGTVLFGALTYIGNGPNLMVKSIADHEKARSPAFLGYLFKWAVPIMLPLLIMLWLVFFR